jgi:hypothetical protein
MSGIEAGLGIEVQDSVNGINPPSTVTDDLEVVLASVLAHLAALEVERRAKALVG